MGPQAIRDWGLGANNHMISRSGGGLVSYLFKAREHLSKQRLINHPHFELQLLMPKRTRQHQLRNKMRYRTMTFLRSENYAFD